MKNLTTKFKDIFSEYAWAEIPTDEIAERCNTTHQQAMKEERERNQFKIKQILLDITRAVLDCSTAYDRQVINYAIDKIAKEQNTKL